MENTGNIFFSPEDNQPIWYIALDNKNWVGPMTPTEVIEKIQRQELTWAHYGWQKNQDQWQRLCDIKAFQPAVPGQPNKIVQVEVKEALSQPKKVQAPAAEVRAGTRKPADAALWFLYYNESQFGPFSADEVRRFISIGKIHGRVHAWCDGMTNWKKLHEIDGFQEALEGSNQGKDKQAAQPSDQRKSPRVPLVARSFVTSGEAVVVAMCRDISIGGMQVLTEKVPGSVGARLKLNVSPTGAVGSDGKPAKEIEPFVAEGVIVRVLEDGRGFSFRFENLSEQAKRVIESYVRSG